MVSAQDSLLGIIERSGEIHARQLPAEATKIVAAWNTEYVVRLRAESTTLHLSHICIETNHIGTSYYERSGPVPHLTETLLGQDVPDLYYDTKATRIAAWDAVYGNIIRAPDADMICNGDANEKALSRATIVCDEVRKIAKDIGGRSLKIVNVGVVGDFIAQLTREKTFDVRATDFYDTIVDREFHGVTVKAGTYTNRFVRESDIALVTGMTLATDTMDAILAAAKESNTKVVLFAETGSNFSEVYLDAGVTTVVAEPFPFYLSGAETAKIRIYRK